MINELINLANELDNKGLIKESDYLDAVIKRYAIVKKSDYATDEVRREAGDPFAEMDDIFEERDARETMGDAHYPENKEAIPGVIEKMSAEINALGPAPTAPGREGMRARSDHQEKIMNIYLKYGLVRQDNNYYTFKLKGGSEVQVAK